VGCQREWQPADRVYDTRTTGSVGAEHWAPVLDLPDTELRIPGNSRRWVRVHAETRRQPARTTHPELLSLSWHGLTAVARLARNVLREHSSALAAVLTSTRQGDKAYSHPEEEGGPT
jgi:hypothetical protein